MGAPATTAPPRPDSADRELIALAVAVATGWAADPSMDVYRDRIRVLEPRATPGLIRHQPVFEPLFAFAEAVPGVGASARALRDLRDAVHRFFLREIGSADK